MCHLCSLVGGVGDEETGDGVALAGSITGVPPLEPIRAVGKPYRLG